MNHNHSIGEYPADWPDIAKQVKAAAGGHCVRCGHGHDPATGYTLTVHQGEDTARAVLGEDEIAIDGTSAIERAKKRQSDYEGYAASNERQSSEAYERSMGVLGNISSGQPVLAGHHSEGRHRRDLERADSAMRQSVEADRRTEYWQDRAAGALWKAERRYTVRAVTKRLKKLNSDRRRFERLAADYPESQPVQRWLDFTLACIAVAEQQLAAAVTEQDTP